MMRTTLNLFILFGCFVFNSITGQGITSKGKLFIIGGGNKPASLLNQMISEAHFNEADYMVVLPMASSYPNQAITSMQKSMQQIGIKNCFGINFDKNDTSNTLKIDSVRKAKIVFISGGDQNRFMEAVLNTPVEKAMRSCLENGGMIAGTSAGAAVMSAIMLTGNQKLDTVYSATFKTIRKNNVDTAQGLGFLRNAIIDQHFIIRSRHNRLLTAILEYPHNIGIGIDESTALMVQGNYGTVFGESQVLVFRPGKHIKVAKSGRFSARDIKVDIFTEGERFKLIK